MVHNLDKAHFARRQTFARVNATIMLGLVGSGFLACMIGASVYDFGRLFSAW